jgi:hypothetical protein
MAFGMKHWMGLTTLGLLLVCVWKLPPTGLEPRDDEFVLPEVRRAEALNEDIERAHRAIMHLRWSDSLSALTVGTAVDGLVVGFPENREDLAADGAHQASVDLSEEKKEELRRRVRDEVAALTPRADVSFGYYLQPLDHGAVEGFKVRTWGQSTYVGAREEGAYCIQVYADQHLRDVDVGRPVTAFSEGRTNAAGACRPYLKYGMPGRHVGEWMARGASDFALAPAPPADPSFSAYRPVRRTFFGLNFFGFRAQSVEVDRCLAGIPEGCLETVTSERTLMGRNGLEPYATDAVLLEGIRSWFSPFGNRDDYLLADLEAAFGPERFQRFWSSEQELPEAFRAAFGVELGEWVVSWVGGGMETTPPGPGLSKSAALGSMLAVSLMAALAGAWARKRRVS